MYRYLNRKTVKPSVLLRYEIMNGLILRLIVRNGLYVFELADVKENYTEHVEVIEVFNINDSKIEDAINRFQEIKKIVYQK